MKSISRFFSVVIITLFVISCKSNKNEFLNLSYKEKLETLFPNAVIDSIKAEDHFKEVYQLVIDQNLDHNNPEAGTFKHYVYVSHINDDSPTVIITDGYASSNRTTELSKLLKSNQIIVEYRMYGKSRPDSIPWKYLTNDNAIEDYHSIVTKLKRIYKGKWLSSGISKGGETTLIYKSKYPEDIDVAVPYVAPIIDGKEDPRTNALINSVGEKSCRDAIRQFQRSVLENREDMLTLMKTHASEQEMTFNEVPEEEALEYSVLEFPFSFWQWGGNCEEIPNKDAEPKVLFDYLVKVSGFGLYADKGFNYYLPSFYQHIRELGYYGFDLEPVKDLLQVVNSSSNIRFAPRDVDLSFNPNYIKTVRNFLEHKGDNILYIYGGYDPWGACAPNPSPEVDALKMVLEGGHHGTRIKDFSEEDQQKIYAKLKEWLGNELQIFSLAE